MIRLLPCGPPPEDRGSAAATLLPGLNALDDFVAMLGDVALPGGSRRFLERPLVQIGHHLHAVFLEELYSTRLIRFDTSARSLSRGPEIGRASCREWGKR